MSARASTAADPAADGYDPERALARWHLARRALALALADPAGLGGAVLHGRHGAAREALLAALARRAPLRRVPADADDDALEGGIDAAATLAAGRPVRRAGLLDAPRGTVLLLAGAERLPARVAARVAHALERGALGAAIVALDEGEAPSGVADSALGERLALHAELPVLARAELLHALAEAGDTPFADAPTAPERVRLEAGTLAEIVRLADALGIASSRAPSLACRAARVAAALDGCERVEERHVALAAQLVLAPRARRAPPELEAAPSASPAPADEGPADERSEPPAREDAPAPPERVDAEETAASDAALPDTLVAATAAALPTGLLETLGAPRAGRGGGESGRDGAETRARARGGRPIGTRRPRARDERLDVAATLRAAVPWQRLRAAAAVVTGAPLARAAPARGARGTRLDIRAEDFRVTRRRRPTRTTTLFLVDASGSAAMHRLAEAKGAVERLLAECYVRRDRVALATFRHAAARLELAPTRSLARARRALVGLPGGGGTPLASGLDLAAALLERLLRDGERPVGVIMSDARANIARDGQASRRRAAEDAEDAARRLGALGARLLFVDTAPRPRAVAAELAALMRARYLPLPALDTATLRTEGER